MDRLLALEEEKNAKYRKRILYLIPFNALAMWGTIKYFQNVQSIAKKYWPKRQKASIGNFFFIGTAQAIFFTTFYIGGSLAILGVNPFSLFKSSDETQPQLTETVKLTKAQDSMKTSDIFVLKMFKTMGLSDGTMALIENDLRNQNLKQKQLPKEEQGNQDMKDDHSKV